MDIKLALMTGVDIPIPKIQATLHQPNMLELSYIGETDFLIGLQCLTINKSMFVSQDNSVLDNTSNFQIFMTIMQEQETKDKKEMVKTVLQLIFPEYKIIFTPQSIIMQKGEISSIIDANNFDILQDMLKKVFCLNGGADQNYNPGTQKAKEIADKLMRGRQRVAAEKGDQQGSAFGRYISILTIGIPMPLSDVLKLTMYQLYDLVERYTLHLNWDLDIRSRLAGGKPDGKPEDWMKNIH